MKQIRCIILLLVSLTLVGCVTTSLDRNALVLVPITNEPGFAFTRLVSVDKAPLEQTNRLVLEPGNHTMGVSCRVASGVSLSFSIDVLFESGFTYCFVSIDDSHSCKVVYLKTPTPKGENREICDVAPARKVLQARAP